MELSSAFYFGIQRNIVNFPTRFKLNGIDEVTAIVVQRSLSVILINVLGKSASFFQSVIPTRLHNANVLDRKKEGRCLQLSAILKIFDMLTSVDVNILMATLKDIGVF